MLATAGSVAKLQIFPKGLSCTFRCPDLEGLWQQNAWKPLEHGCAFGGSPCDSKEHPPRSKAAGAEHRSTAQEQIMKEHQSSNADASSEFEQSAAKAMLTQCTFAFPL